MQSKCHKNQTKYCVNRQRKYINLTKETGQNTQPNVSFNHNEGEYLRFLELEPSIKK